MVVTIDKSNLDFIGQNGTNVSFNDKTFYFLPYWIEVVDAEKRLVVFHSLKKMPNELVEELINLRNGKI